ncbi:MAG: S-adenosylmethionine--diacylglycerol 3-amino-3-carboxypropyl transferase [Pirellulaceae bacterium]|nr:MAG: S-adenosylmethionine--diacylglycerol 3-amino-3-carboxypropyl transferase [Pirellulaceae bacterium]
MSFSNWISGRVFSFVHGNNLVYNTCWEDPRLDREALQLTAKDRVLVITSAGCNALDYALAGPEHVYAVDMNPRQNALLELKIAGIRTLDYEDFFQFFGRGYHPRAWRVYRTALRGELSSWAQSYWDRFLKFFDNPRRTFFYRGTSGAFARGIRFYIDRVTRLRPEVDALLACPSVAEQQEIYQRMRDRFWSRTLNFAMKRDSTLSLLGVPKAQRLQIDRQYPGGILQFVQDAVEAVFARLPLSDNYFWRVYINGEYTPECCPEYLKPENVQRLRATGVENVSVHTDSVQGFLEKYEGTISRFVLLDHMDWLSAHLFPMLELEWRALLRRAEVGARVLWRSGGLRTDFIDEVTVDYEGKPIKLPSLLRLHTDWAAQLHQRDRVHTYGSFYIADILSAPHEG